MTLRSVPRSARLSFVLPVVLLTACGGGGGGSSGPDTDTPYIDVAFPPGPALTTAATVRVRGQADDDRGVASVTVAGVNATSSDGFNTWVAVVPVASLAAGGTAVATDAAGNSDSFPVPAVTQVAPFIQRPNNMAFRASTDQLVVVDFSLDAVVTVDPATGALTEVSSRAAGSGTTVDSILAFTLAGSVAYVVDGADDEVVRVDLATGARTTVASASVGSGTAIVNALALGFDAGRNRVLVLDFHQTSPTQESRLVAIDLATGARSVVSGGGVGSGATLTNGFDIKHDTGADRYLVVSGSTLLGISPTTGARTTLASASVGSGPSLSGTRALELDGAGGVYALKTSTNGTALALDAALLRVDLATGNRTALDTSAVVEPTFERAPALARDPATGELFVGDSYGGRIHRIALSAPTVVSAVEVIAGDDARIGGGPEWVFPEGIAISDAGSGVYVTDSRTRTVTAVSTWSGLRQVISGPSAGAGPAIGTPRAAVYVPSQARLLVHDGDIISVAIPSGDRTLVHDDDGTLFSLWKMALDPVRGRLIATTGSDGQAFAIALSNGARTLFTTANAASPNMLGLGAITYDAEHDDYLIADDALDLFRVNPASGARTRIRDSGLAEQPTSDVSAVVNDGFDAWVIDGQRSRIERVRISSGAAAVVYDSATSGVRGSSNVGDAAHDPYSDIIYWVDAGTKALTAVDVLTGERVIISR